MSSHEGATPHISVRLPAATLEAVDERIRADMRRALEADQPLPESSRSRIIREALEAFLTTTEGEAQ